MTSFFCSFGLHLSPLGGFSPMWSFHVDLHVSQLAEMFATQTAGVWFLPCVTPNVSFQKAFEAEFPVTNAASVWFLSRVTSLVVNEIWPRCENLLTNSAPVSFLWVSFLVGPHVSNLTELFATNSAWVWFFPCVGPHVCVSVPAGTKLFTTNAAGVGLLPGVDPKVHISVPQLGGLITPPAFWFIICNKEDSSRRPERLNWLIFYEQVRNVLCQAI